MNLQIFHDYADWISAVLHSQRMEPTSTPSEGEVVTITIQRGGFLVESPTIEGEAKTFQTVEEVGAALSEVQKSTPVLVCLASDRFLLRSLSDRHLPFGRASEMAAIDIAESLPFMRQENHLLFPEMEFGSGTSYAIVRQSVLDPILTVLSATNRAVTGIAFEMESGIGRANRASFNSVMPKISRERLRIWVIRAVTAVITILMCMVVTQIYLRNNDAISHLAEIVEIQREQTRDIKEEQLERRKALELAQAARAGKAEAVPVSIVWEELTKILPDNTWLSDFSVRENRIVVTGFSTTAADLIEVVSSSPLFKSPSFSSQVMRIPGHEGERFTLQLEVVSQ